MWNDLGRLGLSCAALLALATGCEHASTRGVPTAPPRPAFQIGMVDSAFRLTPAERASVRAEFNVDALERLLQMLPSERRAEVLSAFQKKSRYHGFLVSLGRPELDAVLEEVWAPYWRDAPDEFLSEERRDPIPGRRIERERRAKKP